MKTCPYCAEEIKDEAIKCRWCLSWLVEQPSAAASTPPPGVAETQVLPAAASAPSAATPSAAPAAGEERAEFTHSGERYLLGYGRDFFGIWDRQSPDAPTDRFPRSDEGWRQAWQRYTAMESNWMDLRTGQRS